MEAQVCLHSGVCSGTKTCEITEDKPCLSPLEPHHLLLSLPGSSLPQQRWTGAFYFRKFLLLQEAPFQMPVQEYLLCTPLQGQCKHIFRQLTWKFAEVRLVHSHHWSPATRSLRWYGYMINANKYFIFTRKPTLTHSPFWLLPMPLENTGAWWAKTSSNSEKASKDEPDLVFINLPQTSVTAFQKPRSQGLPSVGGAALIGAIQSFIYSKCCANSN